MKGLRQAAGGLFLRTLQEKAPAFAEAFFGWLGNSYSIKSRMYLMVYLTPFSPSSPCQVREWGSMAR